MFATTDDKITEYLVQEARDANGRITGFMLADERMVATGVALLALTATVAIVNDKLYFLMALPFAIGMFFTFVQYLHSEILSLGGYKAALEEAITVRLGVPVIAWDSAIAPSRHRSLAGAASRVLILLLYAASVGAALYEAWKTTESGQPGHAHSTLLISLTIGSIVVSIVSWAVARTTVLGDYDRVLLFARQELMEAWTRAGDDEAAGLQEHDRLAPKT